MTHNTHTRMRIALGSDHVGLPLKGIIKEYLLEKGFAVEDFGTHSTERMDYPVVAKQVALTVQEKKCERGILICGTGIGMSIAVNKFKGIRAVVCSESYSAMMSRAHNDSNVLALGARVAGQELAQMIVDVWLTTKFEGGRHQNRLQQIAEFEI